MAWSVVDKGEESPDKEFTHIDINAYSIFGRICPREKWNFLQVQLNI